MVIIVNLLCFALFSISTWYYYHVYPEGRKDVFTAVFAETY